ncbi:SRPBCC family protein [Streptomyces sp. NRRL F-5727]|uniref:SRPBCC family protein n=1 Tax=Streptomyces sp. NRRL F-5727 TaxID=1463871 RepID=UPI00131CF679|nr:SRPBCC family protein [Streptomyces sp. NRRL F-5727]
MRSTAETASQVVVDRVSVAAPAEVCFDLVRRVESAPQFFASHLHAEVLADEGRGEGSDTVERWVVLPDGGVRHWAARRAVDVAGRTVEFAHEGGAPAVVSTRGRWSFVESADGVTEVRLEHALTFAADAGEEERAAVLAQIGRGGAAQLGQLREVAEAWPGPADRTVRVGVRARLSDARAVPVFERLLGAAEVYGAGWARAVVGGRALVLKRVGGLDGRLDAATARFDVAEAREGAEVVLSAAVTVADGGPAPAVVERWLRAGAVRALLRAAGSQTVVGV